ncbi:hypothetical protein F5Y16DRAFT_369745 [Xylariaceae sp. FL0255]|nr:hypothetical protein F5Y16DRAFT_369745 [Xylariaceae sp. FL0255]
MLSRRYVVSEYMNSSMALALLALLDLDLLDAAIATPLIITIGAMGINGDVERSVAALAAIPLIFRHRSYWEIVDGWDSVFLRQMMFARVGWYETEESRKRT